MSGIAVQYRIRFHTLNQYPVIPKSHCLAFINNVHVHVWNGCRLTQYTQNPSVEIILPVKLFVLFGYPLRGVNIGLRYRIIQTINKLPDNVIRKMYTHSIYGLTS